MAVFARVRFALLPEVAVLCRVSVVAVSSVIRHGCLPRSQKNAERNPRPQAPSTHRGNKEFEHNGERLGIHDAETEGSTRERARPTARANTLS